MRELVNIACGLERSTASVWYGLLAFKCAVERHFCDLGLSMLCSEDVHETSLFER